MLVIGSKKKKRAVYLCEMEWKGWGRTKYLGRGGVKEPDDKEPPWV
jgi:hypothetical protein